MDKKEILKTIKEAVEEILYGIDMQEIDGDDGWWETSTGAEFGKRKKEELTRVLNNRLVGKI